LLLAWRRKGRRGAGAPGGVKSVALPLVRSAGMALKARSWQYLTTDPCECECECECGCECECECGCE
jgi:hypothetical protein